MTNVTPQRGPQKRPGAPGQRARPPKPQPVELSLGSVARRGKASISTGGEILRFSGRALRALPDLRHHLPEVLHQTGIVIVSSGLIIWAMQFVIGYQCGLEGKYFFDQLGAPVYSGVFNSWCLLREMAPYMYGYIFAAKVGCGLVAEIGSMRISDEVDAMEVMGIRSLSYLVGTRIVAAWLAIPFLFTVGLGISYIAAQLVTVTMLNGVSPGTYDFVFWLFQNPADFAYSMTKTMLMATAIIFVACYYGYTASGGPVGVGRNTAKSMVLNMVLIHLIGFLGTLLFWGTDPNAPIAN